MALRTDHELVVEDDPDDAIAAKNQLAADVTDRDAKTGVENSQPNEAGT